MKMIEDRKAMAGQGGFTLIELLVVIAILAVLAGAAIIGIGSMRSNAETQVCNTDAKTIETAAEAWSLLPGNTGDTVTVGDLETAGLLKSGYSGTYTGATRTGANDAFAVDGTCP